jgi:ketosteroid isomerase-like protein
MSEENVRIVREVYDAWARGDFSYTDPFHPDIEFEMADWPHQTKVRGVQAMSDTWRATLAAFDDFRSTPIGTESFGSRVLVLNRIEASGKESGADVSADTASVFTIENGKVTRLALYWNVDSARREAHSPS